jgi:hypothetical protein
MSFGSSSASEPRLLWRLPGSRESDHFFVAGAVAVSGLAGAPKSGFFSGAFFGASCSQPIAKLASMATAKKARNVRMVLIPSSMILERTVR